jgi:hypothetical protein
MREYFTRKRLVIVGLAITLAYLIGNGIPAPFYDAWGAFREDGKRLHEQNAYTHTYEYKIALERARKLEEQEAEIRKLDKILALQELKTKEQVEEIQKLEKTNNRSR